MKKLVDLVMTRQSTFSVQSHSIPEFNEFNVVKYLCHIFKYLERPAKLGSPSNKVFLNGFFKRR